ncbi:ABC transporter ATP-binding protein [Prosthecomicrobium sp. N25]|uniref:ABC transporter ATP-binding protein n=1 Tax=Prosthecomicrobium sp. N25 TaxID=3129254 RepID=UPI00307835E2
MAAITLERVSKRFGDHHVLQAVDLAVEDGEFVVLVGPSGCGKSTLLRMIAGLEEITAGVLRIGGKVVNEAAPAERDIAMVFQDYALYPHMTVAENMGFGLAMRDRPAAEIAERVAAAARALRIEPLTGRRPAELSGGQRQRVAMGRAIVRAPQAFLFDEPLSNLDAALRVEMRLEMARLHRRMKATTVYVTHDQVEAMTLADRIVVMNQGRIEQVGAPLDLYRRPATLFVGTFIGSPAMNALPATLRDGVAVPAGSARGIASGGRPIATLGIRPEALAPSSSEAAWFTGEIAVVERLGSLTYAHLDLGAAGLLTVEWPRGRDCAVGAVVSVEADAGEIHAFDSSGRRV